ncbi:MAG TPA: bifunctional DedA family/phosphatase PAP2 family protein [Acidimicrobiales bacterium]|nr:bifunctional DedA family/phosphatase PAP2 family protein [Acidimicrobiales bacterium]
MIADLLDRLADLASPWGYVIVGVLALLEAAAMVGLVVPGEAALLVGGFLASQGKADLPLMMAVGAVGAIVGDSIGYEIGKHLGPSLRRSRLGQWVGDERWQRAEDYIIRHGGRAVFFGRFIGVLRALVPTIAGLSGMPYRTFLPWNAIGGLVWAPGFVLLGYAAGGSYHKVGTWTGRASAVLLILVVLVVATVMAARAVVRQEGAVRRWARTQKERPSVARILGRFERQLAFLGRRLRPGAAFGLSVTLALAGVAVVGWTFGMVVQDVISRKDLAGLDGAVYRFFLDHREPALTTASRTVSLLGGTVLLTALTMAIALLVWWRTRRPRDLMVPALAVTGSWVLVEAIKIAVHRPPPPVVDMLAANPGFAFPSGQATRSAACLLTVAFVVNGVLVSWRAKVMVVTAALTLSGMIGLARLTLAVHWLTDVLGGWALGLLWFAVVVVITEVAASLQQRDAGEMPAEPVTQDAR